MPRLTKITIRRDARQRCAWAACLLCRPPLQPLDRHQRRRMAASFVHLSCCRRLPAVRILNSCGFDPLMGRRAAPASHLKLPCPQKTEAVADAVLSSPNRVMGSKAQRVAINDCAPLCRRDNSRLPRSGYYSGAAASACGKCSLSAEGGKGKQR
jgi:hypothetical protein